MFSLSRVLLRRVSIISGGLKKPLPCIIQYPPSYITPYTLHHSSPYLLLIDVVDTEMTKKAFLGGGSLYLPNILQAVHCLYLYGSSTVVQLQ